METCGFIKADGNPCTLNGKNPTKDGRCLCGTHFKKYIKEGGEAGDSTNVPVPAKKEAASTSLKKAIASEKSNYLYIYQNVIKFINNNDPLITITDAEKEIVKGLEKSNKEELETVIKYATKKSSTTATQINYQSIANNIPFAAIGYKRAISLEKKPLKIQMEMFPQRKGCKLACLPVEELNTEIIIKPKDYLNAIFQEFPDVEIRILNCKFITDICKWEKNSDNIYMGPATKGYFTESDWFIPLDSKSFKFREQQNKKNSDDIMERIRKGEEKKEKYLDLIGKNLGCLCMPHSCHCEVYIDVIRKIRKLQE